MKLSLKLCFFVLLFLSPWFWSFQFHKYELPLSFHDDIARAKENVTWKRGKISSSHSIVNRVFLNWPSEVIYERVEIVMENLDIGNYFFANHPRERVGVDERQKFFIFELLIFITGLVNSSIKKYKRFLIRYTFLSLLIVFLLKLRTIEQSIILIVPFLLIMSLGLQKIVSWPMKWRISFGIIAGFELISFYLITYGQ